MIKLQSLFILESGLGQFWAWYLVPVETSRLGSERLAEEKFLRDERVAAAKVREVEMEEGCYWERGAQRAMVCQRMQCIVLPVVPGCVHRVRCRRLQCFAMARLDDTKPWVFFREDICVLCIHRFSC